MSHLTDSELAVLRLIAEGLSNDEIAVKLGMSLTTVSKRFFDARCALGVETRTGLVREGYRRGLLPLPLTDQDRALLSEVLTVAAKAVQDLADLRKAYRLTTTAWPSMRALDKARERFLCEPEVRTA